MYKIVDRYDLKLGLLEKWIRNALKVWRCGAGKGRWKPVGTFVPRIEFCKVSRRTGTSYVQ